MKPHQKKIYKYIAAAFFVSVVFTVAFKLYIDKLVEEEKYLSELYFSDYKSLPKVMTTGETHNVSFILTNHENKPVGYTYTLLTEIEEFSRDIYLGVGESVNVTFHLKPRKRIWDISKHINSTWKKLLPELNRTRYYEVVFDVEATEEDGEVETYRLKPVELTPVNRTLRLSLIHI